MTEWTTDAGSIAILGHTQTGKTVLARQLHAESDRVSIWVNRRGDERVPNIRTSNTAYESVDGIVKGMSRNERKFNLLSGDPAGDLTRLRERMWSWASNTNREFKMQVVIDEIHNVAPEAATKDKMDSRDAVRKMSKEGQKRQVKLIGITQDPVSMDKQSLRQMEYIVLFHNHFTQEKSLERLSIPFSEAQDLPIHNEGTEDEFSNFIVLNSRGNWTVAPPGMKASARYA